MNQPASPPLAVRCLAELIGTFVLIFFGCGVVHAAVLTGAQSGLWQVAIVWGLAVTAAILVVGGISGAHLNPAVTVAMAVWRGFPWLEVVPYIAAQVAGAMLAAAALNVIFSEQLREREQALGVVRGQPGSENVLRRVLSESRPHRRPVGEATRRVESRSVRGAQCRTGCRAAADRRRGARES